MWVGGKYVEASTGKTIAVINPATETILDYVPSATRADTEKAIRFANEAHPSWKRISGVARSEMLHEVANRIKEMKEELARTLTLEGGKPLKENRDEIDWVAACFHYYAEVGRSYRGRLIPPIESSQISMVVKEPYGVVVCIVPWNYPLLLAAWKAAPALAAGNTVIIKPSSLTPL
ncbi:MAG: aldehyde dehydrogenase family protein, partial [Armatimonadetes bacterium]|nr:aldehyde dehydrogenase family protein [Armatimonadota bacterium]